MKKIYVEIQYLENEGCNNGNYPKIFNKETGECIGNTCKCGKGCSNTTRVIPDEKGDFYVIEESL